MSKIVKKTTTHCLILIFFTVTNRDVTEQLAVEFGFR